MSRHRNVRSMNYSDEYDGYDDVYGHSVEDDYCVSPSQAAFMYDREGPKAKPKIGAFFERDHDIAEENEDVESKESNLSDIDRARLEACIEHIKQSVDVTSSRPELVEIVLLCNFNVEKSIKFLLNTPEYKDSKQEKDDKFALKGTKKDFAIPKLNLKLSAVSTFTNETENYTTLGALTNHHLNKMNFKIPTIFERKIDDVVQTVTSLKLNENKPRVINSFSTLDSSLTFNVVKKIDLTKALRTSKSAPQVRPLLLQQEHFVPQFVDYEHNSSNFTKLLDDCCMDISWILKVKYEIHKKPSRFGKIICARYRRSKPSFFHDNKIPGNIQVFKFESPSPDDIIMQYLQCK